MHGPFDLSEEAAYRAWRKQKLLHAPTSAADLIVEVGDPRKLTAAEHAALLDKLRRANMVIYAGQQFAADGSARKIGHQFGLENLDANWLAGEDGISQIQASADSTRQAYIPYTNRPIKWHTDGYYNPSHRQIRGMKLHCVHSAESGGENGLMDHEMAYLLMRDENPDFIHALMRRMR